MNAARFKWKQHLMQKASYEDGFLEYDTFGNIIFLYGDSIRTMSRQALWVEMLPGGRFKAWTKFQIGDIYS